MGDDNKINANESGTSETSSRLLEAAAEVFAEVGFKQATVRDICERAGANVAAVNYHFGDKSGLYSAVMKYARSCIPPAQAGVEVNVSTEQRLEQFIYSYLHKILDQGRSSLHGKIWAREMIDPTPELDKVVEQTIKPHMDLLRSIVREILGDVIPEEQIRLCVSSIIGQCLHYRHSRVVIERLYPEQNFTSDFFKVLAQHITQFSLAGLMALKTNRATLQQGR